MSRLSSKRIPVHSSSRRDAERSRFQGSSKGQEALVTQPIRILDSPLGNEKFLQTHLNRPELRSLE
jgi:hypothetical protein